MTRKGWLFVMGTAPRTGTTLMTWLLNLHPAVHISYETHFPTELYRAFSRDERPPLSTHLPLMSGQLRACLLNQQSGFVEEDDCARRCTVACCAGLRALWEPVQWFGDKAPSYVNHWKTLRELFPDCRVIVMDRAIGEVLPSVKRCDWPAYRGLTDDELRGIFAGWKANAGQIPGAKWIELATVTGHPEDCLADLLDWLELDPQPYPWDRAIRQIVAPEEKIN